MSLIFNDDDDGVGEMEIQALVDGEIPAGERNALIDRINNSPRALERFEALMHQKLLLQEWARKRN